MNLKLLYSFFYNELEKLYDTKNESFINDNQHHYDYEVRKYWYGLNNRYIQKEQITRDNLCRILRQNRFIFRHGVLELLQVSKLGVPITVVSGGLGDIILAVINSMHAKFLKQELSDIVKIYSNRILFDEQGFMYFDDEFFNKREGACNIKDRQNLILVGDNLGDNFMAEHQQPDNFISICLIDQNLTESNPYYKQNDRIKERLKTNVYDIVIKDDANLDLIPLLIHYCNNTH